MYAFKNINSKLFHIANTSTQTNVVYKGAYEDSYLILPFPSNLFINIIMRRADHKKRVTE